MSWQEELRRLDIALAAGKLSKEQYAAQREELLAAASSGDQAKSERATVDTNAAKRPRAAARDLLNTERSTTAPSPADERSTDSMPHPRAPQGSGIQRPSVDHKLPPPVPAHAPLTIAQGPPAPPSSPRGRERTLHTGLFLTLGVIVALALIGGGIWWLGDDQDDPTEAAPRSSSSAPAQPSIYDRLPELPGVFNLDSGTYSVAEGAARKFYGKREAQIFREHNVRQVVWKGSNRLESGGHAAYVVVVAEHEDARTAATVTKSLSQLVRGKAKRTDPIGGLPTFTHRTRNSTLSYGIVFASDRYTLIVSGVQVNLEDDAQLKTDMSGLVKDLTAAFPPSR